MKKTINIRLHTSGTFEARNASGEYGVYTGAMDDWCWPGAGMLPLVSKEMLSGVAESMSEYCKELDGVIQVV